MTDTEPTRPGRLVVELLSDTATARGDATAGDVEIEVEHDDLGLPLVGGRTLHGLLRDAWLTMQPCFPDLEGSAARVLGPARDLRETAVLRVGDAHPAGDDDPDGSRTRAWLRYAQHRHEQPSPAPPDVLRAFTTVRWQTAVNRATGAPAATTLRTTRVLRRGLTLAAPLHWLSPPTADDRRLLALCALAVRHAGLGRNRGAGHVRLTLDGDVSHTGRLAADAAEGAAPRRGGTLAPAGGRRPAPDTDHQEGTR